MPTTQARTEETPKPIRKSAKKAAHNGTAAAPPADFWDHMRSLKPGQFFIYAYRLWPKIDRRDESHYLTKTSEHIDEDWLLRTFGSGKYNLRLNNAEQRSVATKTVSLHNADYPPKVNPLEVTTDPENSIYWEIWGNKKETQQAEAAKPAESNTDTARAIAALEKVVDRLQTDSSAVRSSEREILTSAAQAAIATVREQGAHGGVDVAGILETFAKLMQRSEGRPSGSGELAPIMALMQSQIESQNALMLELLRDRRDSQAPAGGSGISQVAEMVALIRELRNEFSDAPHQEKELPWYAHLAPAIAPTLQFLASTQAQAGAAPLGLSPGPQMPASQPPAGPPQGNTHQEPAAATQQHDPAAGLVRQVLPVIAQPLLMHLTREDTDGADFADYLLAGYPAELVAQAQQVSVEIWRTEIMALPELWQALQASGVDQARLELFIQQFRDYDGSEAEAAK